MSLQLHLLPVEPITRDARPSIPQSSSPPVLPAAHLPAPLLQPAQDTSGTSCKSHSQDCLDICAVDST